MLASAGAAVPRVVTTLHGTDITLVGSDASYKRVVAFSIERSDGVSTVSASLRRDTAASLGVQRDIQVIPNFLDCATYRRTIDSDLRGRLCSGGAEAVVLHVSNFRPVKRVDAAIEVFKQIRRRVQATFVLIGDGPTRAPLEEVVIRDGLADEVLFAGEQRDLVPCCRRPISSCCRRLRRASASPRSKRWPARSRSSHPTSAGFRKSSRTASPDFLRPPDVDDMADCALALLTDPALHASITRSAVEMVLYQVLLAGGGPPGRGPGTGACSIRPSPGNAVSAGLQTCPSGEPGGSHLSPPSRQALKACTTHYGRGSLKGPHDILKRTLTSWSWSRRKSPARYRPRPGRSAAGRLASEGHDAGALRREREPGDEVVTYQRGPGASFQVLLVLRPQRRVAFDHQHGRRRTVEITAHRCIEPRLAVVGMRSAAAWSGSGLEQFGRREPHPRGARQQAAARQRPLPVAPGEISARLK